MYMAFNEPSNSPGTYNDRLFDIQVQSGTDTAVVLETDFNIDAQGGTFIYKCEVTVGTSNDLIVDLINSASSTENALISGIGFVYIGATGASNACP